MSVVTRETRRRWVVAAVAVVAAVSAPTAISHIPQALADISGSDAPPSLSGARELLTRAVATSDVGYAGLAESRGTLGLPDVPRLGAVASLLGGTTRTRVWWSSPQAWRVDVLTAGGERGTYAAPGGSTSGDVVTWDYERNELITVQGGTALRLPRADDLLPPAAAHRLLASVGATDVVTAHRGDRLNGRTATLLRVRASDARSTIGRIDVWVDRKTALPLRVRVHERAGRVVFTSSFVSLSLQRPSPALLSPPSPPDAELETTSTPDLVAAVDERFPWVLPASLAGLPASPRIGGVSTYGEGLVRLVVLPLPNYLAGDALDALSERGAEVDVTGGEARIVTASLVDTLVVRSDDGQRGYLIAGFVSADTLRAAAQQLLDDPPTEVRQ